MDTEPKTQAEATSIILSVIGYMKMFAEIKEKEKDNPNMNVSGNNPSNWTGLTAERLTLLAEFVSAVSVAWHELQGFPGNPLQTVQKFFAGHQHFIPNANEWVQNNPYRHPADTNY